MTNANIISRIDRVIAHYQIGLSECIEIKKELARVSTRASKKKTDFDLEVESRLAKAIARKNKNRPAH